MKIKKITLTIAMLGHSMVFAGSMGPACSPSNLNIPCEANAWSVGAQALYFQPNISSQNVTANHNTASHFTQYLDINPQYSWGFQVEGSYHFNTGNDINLNWYRVESTTKRNFLGETIYSTQSPLNTAFNNFNTNWNAVNLEIGQHIDFSGTKSIRLHGGVQYAHVENGLSRSGSGVINNTSYNSQFNSGSTFNGFGPRIGADMNYDVGYGLGIYANAASSILIGPHSFDSSYNDTTLVLNGARSATSSALVPELEGKLGINYTHMLAQGALTLNVGWVWINYFQVLCHDSYDYSTQSGSEVSDTNFGEQGPFIGLKWIGNIA